MKIYLAGQGYFGKLVLDMIIEHTGHPVVGVAAPAPLDAYSKIDRLYGAAFDRHIPLLPAGSLREATLPDGVDLIIAAHSHDFIGRKTRDKTTFGAIGFHPSLLPLHRGRDAIKWAIRLGERVTGGTVYWLNDTVDGGPIAAQDWCFIPPAWDASRLWQERLQPMGVRLLQQTITDIAHRKIVRIPQDPAMVTWEPALSQPALYRPDLLQIGPALDGYTVIVDRETLAADPGVTAAARFEQWLAGKGA